VDIAAANSDIVTPVQHRLYQGRNPIKRMTEITTHYHDRFSASQGCAGQHGTGAIRLFLQLQQAYVRPIFPSAHPFRHLPV
jgi:hypothetical protein